MGNIAFLQKMSQFLTTYDIDESSGFKIKPWAYKPYCNEKFRFYAYSVISTPISVLYFGGYHNTDGANDMVAEYKNLKWSELGRLASARYAHRSIKMDSKIYIFGGWDTT